MAEDFAADAITRLGWRQGSVLGRRLVGEAIRLKPDRVNVEESDRLIVTSHDCDIANGSLTKEPVVEILRAVVSQSAPDGNHQCGRNPRELHWGCEIDGCQVNLRCNVHDRWVVPRELLTREGPRPGIDGKPLRIIVEWLAKRYFRAAFPTEFNERWRKKSKDWETLLKKNSGWIQGIYLHLNTLDELTSGQTYRCELIVAVPADKRKGPKWAAEKNRLVDEVEDFWSQFGPGIVCDEVDVLGTDEVTLDRIEHQYQRFDADWVSFADDSPLTPAIVDMNT
jgi:hypothetical protein